MICRPHWHKSILISRLSVLLQLCICLPLLQYHIFFTVSLIFDCVCQPTFCFSLEFVLAILSLLISKYFFIISLKFYQKLKWQILNMIAIIILRRNDSNDLVTRFPIFAKIVSLQLLRLLIFSVLVYSFTCSALAHLSLDLFLSIPYS